MDSLLAKKRVKTKITKIRDERDKITTNLIEIKKTYKGNNINNYTKKKIGNFDKWENS